MRLPTRTGFLLAVAALVVAALPAAAGALSSGPSANSQTYQDSTGENPAAPDITSLTVSNDDAGIVSFRINVPNRPTLGQDMVVDLFVDTDANPQTGDLDLGGTDYVIELIQGEVTGRMSISTSSPRTSARRATRDIYPAMAPARSTTVIAPCVSRAGSGR